MKSITHSERDRRLQHLAEKLAEAYELLHLDAVRATTPGHPQWLHSLAQTYLELRRWSDARASAERLLEPDPGSAPAHLTLARCFLHQDQAEYAAAAALEAVGLQFGNPQRHFLLGQALVRSEDWPAADNALRKHLQPRKNT